MTITRRSFLTGCLGAGAFALIGSNHAKRPIYRERWFLFGTRVDASVADWDTTRVTQALDAVSLAFQAMNRDWHPWKPGQMGDINRAIEHEMPAEVAPDIGNMVAEVKRLHQASGGAFNPAIGHIVSLWGFHGGKQEGWRPPDRKRIDKILGSAPSPLDLKIIDQRMISSNSAVKLDLGGYAKGYALNRGVKLLQSAGVHHAVINAGGDLVAMGHQGSRSWRIGIRHPQHRGRTIAWLETSATEAVFTSGNYERYRERDGIRYPHILDPRTGMPVREVASATVIHSDAAVADAAATALVVSATEEWEKVAHAMGVQQAMVVDERGNVQMTPEMAQRLAVVL